MTKLGDLTGDYILDTDQTRIGFVARHTMAARVQGRFDEFTGSAHLNGDDPTHSSASLTIRASSIQTGSLRRDQQLGGKSWTRPDTPPSPLPRPGCSGSTGSISRSPAS
jgi:polyisoprenoid-binding protein YceI